MNHKTINIIIKWLIIICIQICLIIIIGGITRLTGSGLSMVDWKPLMGIIPPLSKQDWNYVFLQYQSYPEYTLSNPGLSLNEFKTIFLWEYCHRILARIIGLSLIIPYLILQIKNQIPKWLNKRILIMIMLVIFQGIIGWYMVKSGLIDKPEVSHFRLATHLLIAFLLLQYIIWTLLELIQKKTTPKHPMAKAVWIWSIGIIIQIIYGAFTAGKKAGWGYNTYPKMGNEWLPESAMMYPSWVENIVENPVMIQFIHRHLGVALGILFVIIWIKILQNKHTTKNQKQWATLVLIVILIQIIIGIATLILKVPLSVAIVHQLMGAILLSSITCLNYYLKNTVHIQNK